MKNKKYTNSFLIGIFVLTGLALLVGFILWMGATQFLKDYDYYVTYFEESVGGLENGASVKYFGVSCGYVQSISIAPDGRLVEIILKLDPNLQIDKNTVAKLEMAGLAGGKYIQLTTADKATARHFDLSFKLPHQLIASAPSQLDELTQSAESIIHNIKDVKWKSISDGLEGTLDGTNKFMQNKDLQLIVSDLQKMTASLNVLAQKLAESSISTQIETTSLSIEKTAKNLEQFTGKLNSKLDSVDIPKYMELIYKDVNTTIASTNNAIDAITSKVQSSVVGVNVLLEDLSKTNKNLNRTLRTINESPYMFLTDPPPQEQIK